MCTCCIVGGVEVGLLGDEVVHDLVLDHQLITEVKGGGNKKISQYTTL